MLDYVIPYVNDRQAFGEPISNRQGVAFAVSDVGIETGGSRLLAWVFGFGEFRRPQCVAHSLASGLLLDACPTGLALRAAGPFRSASPPS